MARRTVEPAGDRARTASTWRRYRVGDSVFKGVSVGVAVGLIALLLWVLASGGERAFAKFGLHFLTGRTWNPVFGRERFGALPFVFGTLVTSAVAIVLAVPVAVGLALLLNEIPSG